MNFGGGRDRRRGEEIDLSRHRRGYDADATVAETLTYPHDSGDSIAGEHGIRFGPRAADATVDVVDGDSTNTADVGVAFAAIQGLAEKLDERNEGLDENDGRIADPEAEMLAERLADPLDP